MKNNNPIIQCHGLYKSFHHHPILENIHFNVQKGHIFTLLGPNGTGKTTLIKILSSLITPTSGRVSILGQDMAGNQLQVRKKIGMVSSESRSFYWRLTARRNLEFFGALYGLDKAACKNRMDALLGRLGQEKLKDIQIRNCSAGMRQILSLIRGLLHDPEVLLLDEPTRSLSPEAAKQVCLLIKEMAHTRKKTILMSSHNLQEATLLSDRMAIIRSGRLVAVGTPDDLKAQIGLSQDVPFDQVYEKFIEKGTMA